jgi:hypothetical protein
MTCKKVVRRVLTLHGAPNIGGDKVVGGSQAGKGERQTGREGMGTVEKRTVVNFSSGRLFGNGPEKGLQLGVNDVSSARL